MYIDEPVANHVAHRHEHASGFEPTRVARIVAFKLLKTGDIRRIQHPRGCGVVGATVILLICEDSLKSVALPSHESSTTIEESRIGMPEVERLDGGVLIGNRIQFYVVATVLGDEISEQLWIGVRIIVIILHGECDSNDIVR